MKIGKAVYRRGKLHFDAIGWALVKQVARSHHQSPQKVVSDALRRYIRAQKAKME